MNEQNELGETPLFWASRIGYVEAIKLLMKYHVDMEVKDKQGKTAFDVAANKEIQDLLRCSSQGVEVGIDDEIKLSDGGGIKTRIFHKIGFEMVIIFYRIIFCSIYNFLNYSDLD